jgi:hypothetical protein
MPDPDTQRAINETLRNVRQRLDDQFEKMRRLRKGEAKENPIRSERMATCTRAMEIVSRFIQPVAEIDHPNE